MIVRQLELDKHGELPARWMAHHLAELITTAKAAEGEEKQRAEDRASELILKLWANRRGLPGQADPLHGHLEAIKVLGAMLPTANPWHRFQRSDSDDARLSDMFGALVQLIMSGLALTRGAETRKIEEAEWEALSEEEIFLVETLSRWKAFIVAPEPMNISLEAFYATLLADDGQDELNKGVSNGEVSDLPESDPEREQRLRILDHLETFQTRLSEMIQQWRSANGLDEPKEMSDDVEQ